MKITMLVIAAALTIGGFAHAAGEPQLVMGTFHTGYVPDGFDSNDKVQVTSEGYFANTCYRVAGYESKIDKKTKVISLTPKAYKYDAMCLQMIVPYYHVVDVGLLDVGAYTVKDSGSGKELGKLNVKLATTSGPDDFLYAPVTTASMEKKEDGRYITVSGEYTNSCVEFKRMMVEVQKNVILVLPITEAADRMDCKAGRFPFSETVKVEGTSEGRYLLHVRTLNGSAVNQLVDLY